MVIYEYKCSKCNKIFEDRFSIGKAPKCKECPSCGSKSMRYFSPPLIQFKGPGFYSTDSKAEPA